MRNPSVRTITISSAAIGVALIWGAVEFFALQWSRVAARWQSARMFPAS